MFHAICVHHGCGSARNNVVVRLMADSSPQVEEVPVEEEQVEEVPVETDSGEDWQMGCGIRHTLLLVAMYPSYGCHANFMCHVCVHAPFA